MGCVLFSLRVLYRRDVMVVSLVLGITEKVEKKREKRCKRSRQRPFPWCSIAVNMQREKGEEEKVFQCREHCPQVHSLAPVSVIDSQSCHKTGHSPRLFL